MSSVISAYITTLPVLLENDYVEAEDWKGSWNTMHNKHAKNTCQCKGFIDPKKEAFLQFMLNFLKHFWSGC